MVKLTVLVLIFGFSALVSSACDFTSFACTSAGLTCPAAPSMTIGGNSYGLSLLDVISFDSATINNGDIQGRAAIRNNFYGLNGISVGDTLADGAQYSLIAGGDANIIDDGRVYPSFGRFFVGASFSAPSYISPSVVDSCSTLTSGAGCLNTQFDSLYNYYSQFSSLINNQAANAVFSVQSGHGVLTCSASAGNYFIKIAGSDFNQVNSFCVVGCNADANWFITITGDVTIQGNPIQVSGLVLYNIVSGTVTVSTVVYGNIVAPNSNINMVGGTIYGTVVAGNFSNIVQINEVFCTGSTFVVPGSAVPTARRSDSFCDSLTGPIVTPTPVPVAESTTGSAPVDTPAATTGSDTGSNIGDNGGNVDNTQNSGAVSVAASLFAVLALAIAA